MAKAIIFAAGLGSRLKPITDTVPKALVKVNGKTLLEHSLNHLKKYGIVDVAINVHHHADQIIRFIENKPVSGMNIFISDERNKLLETGGGLKKVTSFFENEPFFIACNVDIISDLNYNELIAFHQKENALATLVVRSRKTNRYFLFNEHADLCGWKNMQNNEIRLSNTQLQRLNPYAFSGIQVINAEMLSLLHSYGDAFSITDVYIKLCAFYKIKAFIDQTSYWIDVGTPSKLDEANKMNIDW